MKINTETITSKLFNKKKSLIILIMPRLILSPDLFIGQYAYPDTTIDTDEDAYLKIDVNEYLSELFPTNSFERGGKLNSDETTNPPTDEEKMFNLLNEQQVDTFFTKLPETVKKVNPDENNIQWEKEGGIPNSSKAVNKTDFYPKNLHEAVENPNTHEITNPPMVVDVSLISPGNEERRKYLNQDETTNPPMNVDEILHCSEDDEKKEYFLDLLFEFENSYTEFGGKIISSFTKEIRDYLVINISKSKSKFIRMPPNDRKQARERLNKLILSCSKLTKKFEKNVKIHIPEIRDNLKTVMFKLFTVLTDISTSFTGNNPSIREHVLLKELLFMR